MNKHITAAALALTATLALVGCGIGGQDTSSSTTTTTYRSTTTTQKYDSALTEYLRSMRARFPAKTDAQLVSLGEQACDVIDAYGTLVEAMIGIAEDPTWTTSMARDAGFTFGTAIPVFCPQYIPELNRIAR